MKTVLVTTKQFQLPDILSINTLKELDMGSCSCLIFHSTVDSDTDAVLELSKLKGVVPKILYINDDITSFFYCIFTGLGADIFPSESYLSDNEVLSYLIENYKNTGMELKSPNDDLTKLANSVSELTSSSKESVEKILSNNFWLKGVTESVENVGTALEVSRQVNINIVEMMKETALTISALKDNNEMTGKEIEKLEVVLLDMDARYKQEIKDLDSEIEKEQENVRKLEALLATRENEKKERLRLEAELKERDKDTLEIERLKGLLADRDVDKEEIQRLEAELKESEGYADEISRLEVLVKEKEKELADVKQLEAIYQDMEKKTRASTALFFAPYQVSPSINKPIMYVKVTGSGKYLNSFLLAYFHYQKMEKKKQGRVILLLPKMKAVIMRYTQKPNFTRLDRENVSMLNVGDSQFFMTHDPQKTIMDAFFNQGSADFYVVIDYLMGDDMLKGLNVTNFYYVETPKDLKLFNVPEDRAIYTYYNTDKGFAIPHIEGYYSTNDANKRAKYFKSCKETYARMDEILFNKGR